MSACFRLFHRTEGGSQQLGGGREFAVYCRSQVFLPDVAESVSGRYGPQSIPRLEEVGDVGIESHALFQGTELPVEGMFHVPAVAGKDFLHTHAPVDQYA